MNDVELQKECIRIERTGDRVRILVREQDLRTAGQLIAQSEGMTLCEACGRPARH